MTNNQYILSDEEIKLIENYRKNKNKFIPKPLEEVPVAEKCVWFDQCYSMALSLLSEMEEDGHNPTAADLCFRQLLEILTYVLSEKDANSKFWNYWNSL